MIFRLLCSIALLLPFAASAADARVAREDVEFSLSIRTPEQQAAFYSARGFPESAIREITSTCFLTVGIYNRSRRVVWLELANWRITDASGKPVERITRDAWEQTWQRLDVPLASRATFGWTQLPESSDLQPGEPAGGNVAVVAPAGPFKVVARFRTGTEGAGAPIEFVVKDLACPGAAR